MWGPVGQGAGRSGAPPRCPQRRLQGSHTASLLLCPADPPGRVTAGEPLSSSPPWEKVLVAKIRAMPATEKSELLEAICHCIREHSQVGPRDAPGPVEDGSPGDLPDSEGAGPAPTTLCNL